MSALLIIVVTFFGYILAYRTYGSYLAEKIFNLNPKNITPAKQFSDGKDFVESAKHLMFGHHFTSIAGTGPIVGPAIGIIWGWVPALLWIFLGSIFMGAVHDFSALVISMRNEGKSIADITAKYVNPRVRMMFFIIVFLSLLIVIAIFGLVISLIFARFPQAVFAVWAEIPLAIMMGYFVLKKKKSTFLYTSIFVFLMYVTVLIGSYFPFTMPSLFGIPPTGVWTIILLCYAYIASVLPVSLLLQPRDFLNAWQLYIALAILILGVIVTQFTVELPIVAPAFNASPEGAPSLFPFLFITIACGAISGFHCLIASGTSSKQIACESDAKLVGYGAMLVEAGLATLIIIAVSAGIGLSYTTLSGETFTGIAAWQAHYGSWTASTGLGSKLTAVVIGCSNMMNSIGIPTFIGVSIIGVFIASFAGTTLDSATRVQRYIISELFSHTPFKRLTGKWWATGLAVISAALLAFSSGANGKGALMLWPLFGAVNQLLAALSLMVATVYLQKKQGLSYLITGIPCIIMLGITVWASILNQITFLQGSELILTVINLIIVLLALAMAIETYFVFISKKKDKKRTINEAISTS